MAGCGTNTSSSVLVSATHDIAPSSTESKPMSSTHASHAERFGLISPSNTGSSAQSTGTAEVTSTSAHLTKPAFSWRTPSGWQELPNTAMRAANFRVGGDEHAECALTFLAGDGGGLAANVNRWRSQMSLPPASATDIAQLTTAPFLGRAAVLLDVRGTFTGMSGGEARTDHRLIGLLFVDRNGSAFLKMTGPDDVLQSQREAFLDLASSFVPAKSATPSSSTPVASASSTNSARSDSASIHSDMPTSASIPPTAAARGEFAFDLPTGWSGGPDKPSRAVNVLTRDGTTECYVTALNGDGGGLAANLDRWCTQLRLPALLATNVDALPHVTLLGSDARIVQLDGQHSSLLGVLAIGPERSVFVKLCGDRETIANERENFTVFCNSLRTTR